MTRHAPDAASGRHAKLETAHGALNAAYNALAVDVRADTLRSDVALARGYVTEAQQALAGLAADAPGAAAAATARDVHPALERTIMLLDSLDGAAGAGDLASLLDVIGAAMDRIERSLAAAGWD